MKKILAVAVAVVMILQITTSVFAFVDTKNDIFTGSKYTHDDRFAGREITHGLDISVHQGTISNFNIIKAAGVDFMIIRSAYRSYGSSGSLNRDTMFDGNAKGAVAAGIDIGSYIYSQAITVKEAQDEADYILNIVKDYEITLPIMFDYEYYSGGRLSNANLTNRQRTDICLAFCERIEAAGYTAGVYANHSMFKNDLYADEIAEKYILWLAQYHTKPELGGTFFQPDYEYWQYSSSGGVNGIAGRVDCNFRYFKAPDKIANLKLTTNTSKQPVLTWDKNKNCYGYEIYKFDVNTQDYEFYATNKGAGSCTFTDTSTEQSSYKVRAISRNKGRFVEGEFSDEVGEAPSFKATILSTGADYVTLKWTEIPNAARYSILRTEVENGAYTSVGMVDAGTTVFTDKFENETKTYYYLIKAIICNVLGDEIEYVFTEKIKLEKVKVELPETTTGSNDTQQPTTQQTTTMPIETTIVPTECKHTSFEIVGKKAETYFEDGYTGDKVCGLCKFEFVKGEKIERLTLKVPNFKLVSGKKQFKIKYTKVSGATGFQIRYRIKGKWITKNYTTKKTVTKTIKKLKKGNYKVQIRAFVKSGTKTVYSSWSKTKSVKVK